MEKNPREAIVSTAVKFLQNAKVRGSSKEDQTVFLEKKGLTKEEINLAFQEVGPLQPVVPYTSYPPNISHELPLVVYEESTWSKLKTNFVSFLVMGGLSYAFYRVLKQYVIPLLWEDETSKRLNVLEEQNRQSQKSLQETLTTMKELVTLVNEQMRVQNEKLGIIITNTNYSGRADDFNSITEIKTGITTLKGLLLNRRQFPPTPQTTPIIPSWQRESPPSDDKLSSPVSSPSSPQDTSPKPSGSWVRVDTSPTRFSDIRHNDVTTASAGDVTASSSSTLQVNGFNGSAGNCIDDVTISNGDVTGPDGDVTTSNSHACEVNEVSGYNNGDVTASIVDDDEGPKFDGAGTIHSHILPAENSLPES